MKLTIKLTTLSRWIELAWTSPKLERKEQSNRQWMLQSNFDLYHPSAAPTVNWIASARLELIGMARNVARRQSGGITVFAVR